MGKVTPFSGKSWWVGRPIDDARLLAEGHHADIIRAMWSHLRRKRGVSRLDIIREFESIALSVRLDEEGKEATLQHLDALRAHVENIDPKTGAYLNPKPPTPEQQQAAQEKFAELRRMVAERTGSKREKGE